eukprot:COSAG04_NODE_25520_length_306_cov_0.917874_1_plen_65_part_10
MEALGAEVQRLRAENDSLRAENKSLRGLVGASPPLLAGLQPPTIKQEATMHLAAMMSPPRPPPGA